MRRTNPVPKSKRVGLDEVSGMPSFADWFATSLYDEAHGYYSSGNVSFGVGGDFSTFPERLSPLFGWMLVDVLEEVLPLIAADASGGQRFTFLEFGGGNGDLARDVMERLDSVAQRWPQAERIDYRLVEPSAALRGRQRARLAPWIDRGRAEVIAGSITDYRCDDFAGFVFGNEVIDALPPRQLIIDDDGVFETWVAATPVGASSPLDASRLPELFEAGSFHVEEWHAPASLPAAYDPLVDELRQRGLTPTECYASSAAEDAIETIASLVGDGRGIALLIDYGGTARQCTDPRVPHGHLRAYGEAARLNDPYQPPGQVDLTWDVDFTALGYAANAAGLTMHFGHQCMLESAAVDLWGDECRQLLVERRLEEGYEPEVAETVAEKWVFDFREGHGFRAAFFLPDGVELDPDRFDESDPWKVGEVAAIADGSAETVRRACEELGLEEAIDLLYPGADVVGALSDVSWYEARHQLVDELDRLGALSPAQPEQGQQ